MRNLLVIVFYACLFYACDETAIPHQKGYLRLELPPAKYKVFDPEGCPFKFEVSEKATLVPDTNSLSESCWWYINYPSFNAQIFLSYKTIDNNFSAYAEDSRTLVYKHTQRANSIEEEFIKNDFHASGILYSIGGDAASSVQFYMSDSSKHFLRGALYFNSAPNSDSLAPVIQYIKKDIDRMLATLQWK
ncbi:MAG: gliding motility lipoprotein GldD [Bacteroidota bacterium]